MPLTNWDEIPRRTDEPDFNNLLAVLQRQVPRRFTMFEFIINDRLLDRLAPRYDLSNPADLLRRNVRAFHRLGFDYTSVLIPGFSFTDKVIRRKAETVSLDEGAVIHNRKDFDAFPWPDPDIASYDIFDHIADDLPGGMKLIPFSPDGVLENVTNLVGFKGLIYMMRDDPQLTEDIFDQVGTRLLRYYEKALAYDCVGACIVNDDWGYQTSTLFSPATMRRYVFPWHKRIVEVCHKAGRPVVLHSCGRFDHIIEDIVEEMKFDGRHSYEDKIFPVEKAYEEYHNRIAILGGIDVDFIARSKPKEVYQRARLMLERVADRGGYALGTGNSVPEYVPDENYFALIWAALDMRQ